MDTIVKVALGIFFGALLVFLFRVAYVNYVMKEVTQVISESSQKIIQENDKRIQLRENEISAKKRQKEQIKEAKQKAKSIELARARKKLEAWDSYYKTPEECRVYKSKEQTFECANIRVRAKREFEEKWKQNAL